MDKEKKLPVEKIKKQKKISEKKADKNEIKALLDSQKKEMLPKTNAIKDLKRSLKGKSKETKKKIKTEIAVLIKEKKALAKTQKADLKKKKKELKHKYKIASKAKKQELKNLKKQYKIDLKNQKQKIKELKASLKGKTKAEKKSLAKTIKAEKKNLKEITKNYKKAVETIKKELKELKEKMKKPKGRVRILPIIIVAIIFTGIYVFTAYYLDSFLKKTIINVVESSYGAKCDIGNLDVEIIDSYFLVEEFTLANKDKPMENIFEFSKMMIDFDLTQLLLARFVSDEISFEGVTSGSPRTISGELPKAQLAAIEKKKQEKAEKQKDSEFHQAMNDITGNLGENSNNFIQDTIAKFSIDNILDSYLEQLTLPPLIDGAKTSVTEITTYWQDTIPEFQTDVTELTEKTEELVAIYQSKDTSPQGIKNAIESSTSVLKESQAMYNQIDELYKNIEKDSTTIGNLSSNLQSAIANDKNFITTEIDKIVSFDMGDAEGLISSMVEDYIVAALGEYYPIVLEGINYLQDAKSRFDTVAKKEEKKESFKRLKGQTILFNKQMPSFLIKEMNFSGADAGDWFNINGFIHDITHQPDLIGVPITSNIDLSIDTYDLVVDGIVDVRTEPEHELVELAFVGDGLDTDFLQNQTTVGIPSVDAKMGVEGDLYIKNKGDFLLDSKFIFEQATLTTSEFEPKQVYDIYSKILKTIHEFYLDAKIGFGFTDGITINLATDADKKIMDGLEVELNNVIEEMKVSVQKEVEEYLKGYLSQFDDEIAKFNSAKENLAGLKDKISDAKNNLENTANGYKDKIKQETEAAVQKVADEAKAKAEAEAQRIADEAKAKAEAEAQRIADEAKAKAEEAVKDKLGGFLKGF